MYIKNFNFFLREICEKLWLIEWSLVYLYLFKLYMYSIVEPLVWRKSLVASYGFKIGTDGA